VTECRTRWGGGEGQNLVQTKKQHKGARKITWMGDILEGGDHTEKKGQEKKTPP